MNGVVGIVRKITTDIHGTRFSIKPLSVQTKSVSAFLERGILAKHLVLNSKAADKKQRKSMVKEENIAANLYSFASTLDSYGRSILDNGSTHPFFNDLRYFKPDTIRKLVVPVHVKYNNGTRLKCTHTGTAVMRSNLVLGATVELQRSFYVPGSDRNLVPVNVFSNLGYFCDQGGGGCRIRLGADGPNLFALPQFPEDEHGQLMDPRSENQNIQGQVPSRIMDWAGAAR